MQENRPTAADGSLRELPDDLNEFVSQLAHFEAAPSTLDREQLMFKAGREAALAEIDRRSSSMPRTILRVWQSAAIVMTAVSLGLATTLVVGGSEPRVIVVDQERTKPAATLLPHPVEHMSPSPLTSQQNPSASRLVQNSHTPEGQSPGISQSPSSITRQLTNRELALDAGMNLANTFSIPRTAGEPSHVASCNEPPLSPRSLLGDQARLTLDRLMKESTL